MRVYIIQKIKIYKIFLENKRCYIRKTYEYLYNSRTGGKDNGT